MTKNEERKVLKQIEQLIASTGEDSYIATAFAGCVSIAFQNIENDWACSHEATIATANKNIEQLSARVRELEAENEALKEDINDLMEKLNAAKAKQLPAALYRDLWLTVDEQITNANKEIDNLAELLACCSDTPTDIAVTSGLKRLKTLTEKRSTAKRILASLEKHEV